MKNLFLALFAVFLAFALPMSDAEAKRFGGGRSSGMQRDGITQRQATPPQAPQRNADAASPAQNGTQNAAAGAANQAGKRSWMGPIAGLAAGLGLAALASHFGFGEELANFLMIALLVMAAIFLFKWLTRSKTAQQGPAMQYAGQTPATSRAPAPLMPAGSAAAASATASATSLPAGFDADAFTRQAKLNFLRLQAAYDAANLDDIREFTSPEMFAEIQLQLGERGAAANHTDVQQLHAEVLEAMEDSARYVVSVRFSGLIQEDAGQPAAEFAEIWHLTKPAQGSQGWVVAGIQQVQ